MICAQRRVAPKRDRADDGTVLLLTLILLVVGSLIVGGLSTLAIASLRALPTAKSRTTRIEAVKSATRMAMSIQRSVGPSGCFAGITSWTIDDLPVTVTCSTLETHSTGNERYALITTATTDNVVAVSGRNGAGFVKPVEGRLLINGGLLSGSTADIQPVNSVVEMSRYTSAASPLARYRASGASPATGCDDPAIAASDTYAQDQPDVSHTLSCIDDPWWTRAGDVLGGVREYPALAQIPTYVRDGSLATIGGSCKVFYPGRYTSGGPLVLSGRNYFASGVYYFERPIQVAAGASVVFGDGRYPGCTDDPSAALAPTAPKSHEITGRGATIILGGSASITVAGGAALTINRRISSPATRGTEGQAIHVVSFGVDSPAVEVPVDQVRLADGSLQPVTAHQIHVGGSGPAVTYSASTLTPSSAALHVDLGPNSNVLVDGYVFAPQAKVVVNGNPGVTNYGLRLFGGIVASNVALNVASAPATTSKWFVGTQSEVIQRRFSMVATALVDGHTVESRSSFELRQDGDYAINFWNVSA